MGPAAEAARHGIYMALRETRLKHQDLPHLRYNGRGLWYCMGQGRQSAGRTPRDAEIAWACAKEFR